MITSLMLVCAVLASLALGVLMAYGICLALFRLLVMHTVTAVQEPVQAAPVRVVEG